MTHEEEEEGKSANSAHVGSNVEFVELFNQLDCVLIWKKVITLSISSCLLYTSHVTNAHYLLQYSPDCPL